MPVSVGLYRAMCTYMYWWYAVMTGDGYVHVATIPAGATYIELRENSNNYVGAQT